MIRSSILLLPLLALPFLSSSAHSPEASASEAVIRADDTPLQLAMGVLKKGQRALKKQVGDVVANETSLLATLDKMEAAALVGISAKLPTPDGLAGKDLGLFKVGYKRQMVKLLGHILEIREATLLEDSGAATVAYGALGGDKKAGHQAYQVD